jgi:hypothetical protein
MIALLIATVAASAAYSQQTYQGQGYFLYGIGRAPGGGTAQQIGGGGDVFVYKGLAAGGELGYLYTSESFAYGVGLFSANGTYYFNRKVIARFSPFVSAGYSLAFRGGSANLYNFGGGATWWMARHVGIRLEFRDYVWPGSEHSPQFRVGVSFR